MRQHRLAQAARRAGDLFALKLTLQMEGNETGKAEDNLDAVIGLGENLNDNLREDESDDESENETDKKVEGDEDINID